MTEGRHCIQHLTGACFFLANTHTTVDRTMDDKEAISLTKLRVARAAALFVIAVLVIPYCLVTVLYCLPSNPLRIANREALIRFEQVAYQKWSFFAPPGKHVSRLYYTFLEAGDTTVELEVEVLEELYRNKMERHPFNIGVESIDYIVSGAADAVQNQIAELFKYRQLASHLQARAEEALSDTPANGFMLNIGLKIEGIINTKVEELALETLDVDLAEYGPLRTLVNYATLIAEKKGLQLDGLICHVTYTQILSRRTLIVIKPRQKAMRLSFSGRGASPLAALDKSAAPPPLEFGGDRGLNLFFIEPHLKP